MTRTDWTERYRALWPLPGTNNLSIDGGWALEAFAIA
jgi:hypothetical protein